MMVFSHISMYFDHCNLFSCHFSSVYKLLVNNSKITFGRTFLQGHLKKMFWFSDNGFKKKGKVGRVFIFCFYFQSNMGRVFIYCFYFQRFKNITQTSSILLFWQTNNTIVFTLSTGRIVHRTICLESNCTLKLTRTVFSFCMAIKTSHRPKF